MIIIHHHHPLHHHLYSVDKGTYRKTKVIKITIILEVTIQPRPQGAGLQLVTIKVTLVTIKEESYC